jgi:hypothetical protein
MKSSWSLYLGSLKGVIPKTKIVTFVKEVEKLEPVKMLVLNAQLKNPHFHGPQTS